MKKSYAIIFFLLFVTFRFGSAERGCPLDPETILPCVCTNRPYNYLECKNIEEVEDLRNVFVNSARYSYKEVHIENSTLQYLPHDMYKHVRLAELYLTNVTLSQLFYSPPEALGELMKLRIESTVLLRGILWEMLKPLKSLKHLEIYYNSIRTIGKDFSKNVPKDLEEVTFHGTELKTIHSGVFDEFTKLYNVKFKAGKLKEIRRDMLPIPFRGYVLYFNDNKISYIPDDMFSQMPRLQSLGLGNNRISTVPESAFEGSFKNLQYLMLSGNPIKCDCRLLWLIRKKPIKLLGTCESPKKLHGREMNEVSPSDMNC